MDFAPFQAKRRRRPEPPGASESRIMPFSFYTVLLKKSYAVVPHSQAHIIGHAMRDPDSARFVPER